jgi:hypothetical protein
VAQIFYVTCPRCNGKFPCHPELWQVEYALLCPFCQNSFPQEESPLIITGTGEQRPGSMFARGAQPGSATNANDQDPAATAESM